ncbi:hypothetical protein NC653_032777 [Populus alba x Populus x berolinensis]|uniref:Uncharacterized protein n=1 Tax=Populus alba x Populus x berolinensis TaxID=444605 RepID=A0AAD6PZG0_9ROSI|nr:hypothetical protein NC653_032777 [Populus alba x Populus x berolinensis]
MVINSLGTDARLVPVLDKKKKKGVKRCSQRRETALLAQQIIIKVAKNGNDYGGREQEK